MWHLWRQVHRAFWWRNLREGIHLEDLDVDGRVLLKWIFKENAGGWSPDDRNICRVILSDNKL
jgi:hypothetical protein